MSLLSWSLAGAASIHIIEEFAFPGGFKAWWCTYKPDIAASVSNRFLIIINSMLIAFSVIVALALSAPKGNGVAAWLTLAALLFSNAIFHIIGAVQTKRYSPGMISGIVLYIPLAIYGFAHFLRSGQASMGTALLAVAIGGSYHFISFANHRRRAQTAKAK
jgi:uncharacterized protein with HXXEE motif